MERTRRISVPISCVRMLRVRSHSPCAAQIGVFAHMRMLVRVSVFIYLMFAFLPTTGGANTAQHTTQHHNTMHLRIVRTIYCACVRFSSANTKYGNQQTITLLKPERSQPHQPTNHISPVCFKCRLLCTGPVHVCFASQMLRPQQIAALMRVIEATTTIRDTRSMCGSSVRRTTT